MPANPVPDAPRRDPDGRGPHAAHAELLRSIVDLRGIRPLTVVVDAGDGVGGPTVSAVLGTEAGLTSLPLDVIMLSGDLDATSAGRASSRLEPEDVRDLSSAVVEHGADLGLAFDRDAGRCLVVDENGDPVSPSAITALVALREVARELTAGRRPTIVHDVLTSRAVPDLVEATGARAVVVPADHTAVERWVARHDAVFGGAHTAHYAFRDVGTVDFGMLAAMHVLAALGSQPHALSTLVELYEPYAVSGEITQHVEDAGAALSRVVRAYVTELGAGPVAVDERDCLTVSHWDTMPRWWFALRASDAEPFLQLDVEAVDEDIMVKVRDDVLALVRNDGESPR